ncbi:hypothetical protein QA645_13090 [Bradyrhizobium sp. CIAT3101]|uniref:hypothetical protein n=1 Tax=Bradyrhizobium sp. CIAT3101 TaxID=439387 RepID=UPI0024B12568|nr:hypothetical protein [Bradyrhizobium sp. CIAT3101]WFU83639.1 hypothetical protein QA645_13090 [Bradyrhizobium sp. CIAT3101]
MVISAPDVDGSFWPVLTQSMAAGPHAVKRDGRSAAIAAMLKPDSGRYSAHDVAFFEHQAVAAASRNI